MKNSLTEKAVSGLWSHSPVSILTTGIQIHTITCAFLCGGIHTTSGVIPPVQ